MFFGTSTPPHLIGMYAERWPVCVRRRVSTRFPPVRKLKAGMEGAGSPLMLPLCARVVRVTECDLDRGLAAGGDTLLDMAEVDVIVAYGLGMRGASPPQDMRLPRAWPLCYLTVVALRAITAGSGSFGGVPKWPNGAVCKIAGSAFDGSNPSPSTMIAG